jgi:alkyl hydroperoxide reductase subunit AhpF
MEKVLNDQIVKQINEVFEGIQEPVQVLFFGSKDNCDYCNEAKQLLEEVTALSDKLELSVYDMQENADVAGQFNVTNTPGIVIAAKNNVEVKNLGIQFSGIPSGHEFSTLINDILIVSKRESGLDAKTREFLKNIDKPLHLQVFVTPT